MRCEAYDVILDAKSMSLASSHEQSYERLDARGYTLQAYEKGVLLLDTDDDADMVVVANPLSRKFTLDVDLAGVQESQTITLPTPISNWKLVSIHVQGNPEIRKTGTGLLQLVFPSKLSREVRHLSQMVRYVIQDLAPKVPILPPKLEQLQKDFQSWNIMTSDRLSAYKVFFLSLFFCVCVYGHMFCIVVLDCYGGESGQSI